MTVSLTYDDTNARVLIDVDGFDTDLSYVMIERSTDQVRWTTVRGATAIPIFGGAITGNPHSDYEFAPGVTNYYRLRARAAGIVFINRGTISVGASGTRLPVLPSSIVNDDALLLFAATRDVDGTVDDVSGWTRLRDSAGYSVFGQTYAGGGAPTVTFSNSDVNETTMATIAAWRYADLANTLTGAQSNDSQQDIPYAAQAVLEPNSLAIISGFKRETWDSASTDDADYVEFLDVGTSTGNNAGIAGYYHVQTTRVSIVANDILISGGAVATSEAITLAIAPLKFSEEQTANIVPDLTQVWIKSTTRPFLNTPLGTACSLMGSVPVELLVSPGGVQRTTRAAIFPIINRTFPVGITDLALGRTWTLRMRTFGPTGHQTLDYLFASGDVLFIQVPGNDCAETIEHGYVIAQDPAYQRHHRYRQRVVWETGVIEVAPPGPDIGYREATWATVLAQFGSWSAVMAACPTWADVLALLPQPSEVIVP